MIKSESTFTSNLDQMHQNLWDAVKAVITGKCLMLTLKKKFSINNQNLCLKELEKIKLNQSQQNEGNNKVREERNRE